MQFFQGQDTVNFFQSADVDRFNVFFSIDSTLIPLCDVSAGKAREPSDVDEVLFDIASSELIRTSGRGVTCSSVASIDLNISQI